MKVLRDLGAGVLGGVIGTVAMDLLWYSRYRRGGGKEALAQWEFAGDIMSWEQASAPGQFGRKAWRRVTGGEPPDEWARATTNVAHWATGISWGVAYAVLASRRTRRPLVRRLGLGPVAWLTSYAVLPISHVYKPIWQYDARTLADDLSAHLVYGAAASAVFEALTKGAQ